MSTDYASTGRLRTRTPLRGDALREMKASIRRTMGFRFLKLPPEVRGLIYGYVAAETKGVTPVVIYTGQISLKKFGFIQGTANKTLWAMVRVSKALHEEALQYLYDGMTFQVHAVSWDDIRFPFPPIQLGMVQNLRLHFNARNPEWYVRFCALMKAAFWGAGLEHLHIALVKPEHLYQQRKEEFGEEWKEMLRDWHKLKLDTRVGIKITGRGQKRLQEELEGVEEIRLAKLYLD